MAFQTGWRNLSLILDLKKFVNYSKPKDLLSVSLSKFHWKQFLK